MLLIFPPVAKPCEPPAGIAKLCGALQAHGISCRLLDMNLEAQLYLLAHPPAALDTWTRRAVNNISEHTKALRDSRTYRSLDRYSRAVRDISRVLEVSGRELGVRAGFADYQDRNFSPLRSADLITAAAHPERNLFYPYFKKRLPEILEKEFSSRSRPEQAIGRFTGEAPVSDSVGFSLNYLSQALTTFSMIGFIRKEFPGVTVILGGGLVTSWMKRPGWNSPFRGIVDHLVCGPGEQALLSFFGITSECKHHTPDYGSLRTGEYLSPGFILPYSASSGCYWNKCSFCPEPAEGNPYVPIPVHHAIADLNALIDRTKPAMIHLLDSSISPALMRALLEKQVGAPWYGFARIHPDLTDRDFCMALKQSGCRMLKLGLESGDQHVLDSLQKGIDLEMASKVLKNLHRAGIAAYVYLLFGTPVETIDEARKTLDFIVRHKEAVTFLNLAIFNMPVCANEAREFETEQFYEGDLSLYTNFRHRRGWSRRQVRQFLDNEFKRDKAVSAIMKNDPPVFTSNHAPFVGKKANF